MKASEEIWRFGQSLLASYDHLGLELKRHLNFMEERQIKRALPGYPDRAHEVGDDLLSR